MQQQESAAAAPPAGLFPKPRTGRRALVAGGLFLAALLAVAAAWRFGAEGKDDGEGGALQRATATGTAPTYQELSQHLERHPDDARARVLKARIDLREQRHDLAVAEYARAVTDTKRVAREPDVWVEYAEALGLAQGGKLAGKPTEMLQKALAITPGHARALDLAGSAAWERGEFALAVQFWQRLLQQLDAADPRRAELAAAIEAAEKRARFSLPPQR